MVISYQRERVPTPLILGSIVVNKEILRMGMVWKIELGGSTNIWRDSWIPMKSDFVVGEPCNYDPNLIKVSQIIAPREHCWDETLIRTTFNEQYVEEILKILLRQSQYEDTPCWLPDPKACFSVKKCLQSGSCTHGNKEYS